MSKVVNIKNSELKKMGYKDFHDWNSYPQNTYIGRTNPYLQVPSSIFANPYKIHNSDRETVLKQYENYIRNSPHLMSKIHELDKKNLGCYCFPQRCHGNILIKILVSRMQHIA